ncbi:hypothetical protein SFUMM280S_08780 [Streptomyces fumanus]
MQIGPVQAGRRVRWVTHHVQQRVGGPKHRFGGRSVKHRRGDEKSSFPAAAHGRQVRRHLGAPVLLDGQGPGEPVRQAPVGRGAVPAVPYPVGQCRHVAHRRLRQVGEQLGTAQFLGRGHDADGPQMTLEHPVGRRAADLRHEVAQIGPEEVGEVVREHHREMCSPPDERAAQTGQLPLDVQVPRLLHLRQIQQQPVARPYVPRVEERGALVVGGVREFMEAAVGLGQFVQQHQRGGTATAARKAVDQHRVRVADAVAGTLQSGWGQEALGDVDAVLFGDGARPSPRSFAQFLLGGSYVEVELGAGTAVHRAVGLVDEHPLVDLRHFLSPPRGVRVPKPCRMPPWLSPAT